MPSSVTASTRRTPSLDVYQDPDASSDSRTTCDVDTTPCTALQPLGHASHKQNVQLQPTTTTAQLGSSPRKTDSSPLRPMSTHGLRDMKLPPPAQPDFTTDSLQKRADFYPMYLDGAQVPDKGLFTKFSSITTSTTATQDKENLYEGTAFPGVPHIHYSEQGGPYKGPMKRGQQDAAAPTRDRSIKRVKMEKDEPFELPDPQDMPPVTDDGAKPPHSYAELIGMAILRAPNRRLTLAHIYKWISDNFAFYRLVESGWQNSIRHNLSLNKNFIKQERPKDDPGKGNYWAIKPGEERPYLMGKNAVRRVNPDGSSIIHGLPSDGATFRSSSVPAVARFTLAPNASRRADSKTMETTRLPVETDLSSDGTIPGSDPALQEDGDGQDHLGMPPPPSHFRSSPPPQDIRSSPPQMLAPPPPRKGATPPPVPRFPSTSRSGGRRRKLAAMQDSGYWSSIESSAARAASHQLTSEADLGRHRISKKGRAELEIKRMRSSSFDSPSKDKLRYKASTSHLHSSSPLKDDQPLTPAIPFKRPPKPPPSVSPNTNLRNHRDRMRALLGSPAKTFSPIPENASWSPAFNLAEDGIVGLTPYISPYKPSKTPWKSVNDNSDASAMKKFDAAFDIFIDAPEEDLQARGSPEKRMNRRPSLARAATSTGILADITGSAKKNNITLTPAAGSPFSLSPFLNKPNSSRLSTRLGSPLKQCDMPLSVDQPEDDLKWLDTFDAENQLTHHDDPILFGNLELPSDGSEEAIDIFQDFGKIGQHHQTQQYMPAPDRSTGSPVRRSNMGPPARPAPRPTLARSSTSRW
nr:forkhead protein sep1 [Quercus suber]